MQNDITLSLSQLIWITGGILALWAFVKWIKTPFVKLDEHEERIKVLEQQEAERKSTDRYMVKALNALVTHMIDGNGIDELKKVRDEFHNSIINHM